jgi:hypothetical protein
MSNMARPQTSRVSLSCLSALALMTATFVTGCAPTTEGVQSPREHDPCVAPLAVLATTVLERDKGQPGEAVVPFEIDPEKYSSTPTGGFPVCVVVTNLNEKPRVIASGSFTIDDIEVFGPSAFNENTAGAMALHELEPGPHELRARLASAPGASVRVQVLMGSARPLPTGPNVGSVLIVPDKETVLSLGGATFTFPPGAVDVPVTVTAIEVSELYAPGNRFVLLPDGMQFEQPFQVELPYDPQRFLSMESTLLEVDSFEIRCGSEWMETSMDFLKSIASTVADYLTSCQLDTPTPRGAPVAGGILWRKPNRNLIVQEIPLGRVGYRVAIKSTPQPGATEPERRRKLRAVTSLLDGTIGDYVGINLSQWAAGNGKGCNLPNVDCGVPNEEERGVGLLVESVFSSNVPGAEHVRYLAPEIDEDGKSGKNYFILIRGGAAGDLYADGFMHYQVNTKYLVNYSDLSEDCGDLPLCDDYSSRCVEYFLKCLVAEQEHAVLIGSKNAIIRSKFDNDTCRRLADDRHTVLGIGTTCTVGEECLLLISTIAGHASGSQICDELVGVYHAKDAIELDGGHSSAIVHSGQLLNPLYPSIDADWYQPARFVANALAVSHVEPLPYVASIEPLTARLGAETEFTIRGGNLPDSTVAWIADCAASTPGVPALPTDGTSQERTFSCTPGGATGPRATVVKQTAGGAVFRDDIEVTFVP